MPMGFLMIGLLGGIAAALGALLAGQPLWMALGLYLAVGNLLVVAGIALQELGRRRGPRPPDRRRTRAPARRPLARPAGAARRPSFATKKAA